MSRSLNKNRYQLCKYLIDSQLFFKFLMNRKWTFQKGDEAIQMRSQTTYMYKFYTLSYIVFTNNLNYVLNFYFVLPCI